MFLQIDNDLTRVTKFILKPNDATGNHVHKLNYVIVPITDAKLKLVDNNNEEKITYLKSGEPYYREAKIEHNVINIGNNDVVFIEIELKKFKVTNTKL
tara:strand:- start:150 stop:443 length:294 start_codon:yes stop_codon:yes gene_type:complete